jgi:hypothetical protein
MKKSSILTLALGVIVLTVLILPTHAQTKNQKLLVGIWRQTGTMTIDGKLVSVVTGNYRITNPDNTFLMFSESSSTLPNAAFWQSGTIQYLSDSSSVEKILMHKEGEDGRSIYIRFNFLNENKYLSQWSLNGTSWVAEIWERIYVPNLNTKPTSGTIDAKEFQGLNIHPIDSIGGKIK